MKPKFTLSALSVMARRRARLTVIMREAAGTQVSLPGQSLPSLHQMPLSAHILAGWPSAQKSPARLELQEVAPEAQVVFAVVTPCLHEPQGLPDVWIQDSACMRPDQSVLEMMRQ